MANRLFIIFALLISLKATPQYFEKERKLINEVENASTDSNKIKALHALAEFYYIYRAEDKGDSVLQKQLVIAELSNDKSLILQTLFSNTFLNISSWTRSEILDRALSFLDQGLLYAKETNKKEYEAIANLNKAIIYRKRANYDQAISCALQAFTASEHIKNDSLKAKVYLELGSIHNNKGDAVSAYRNFNNAYNLAYTIKNIQLQSEVLHNFSELYNFLGNKDLAKQSLLKSMELNNKHKNMQGLLVDYIDLARLTEEKEYIERASVLAETLKSDRYRLFSKKLFFVYNMVIEKNHEKTYNYLLANEDLKQSYLNTGTANYYWTIGNIFRYANEPDSALYYYLKAEPEFEMNFDPSVRMHLNNEIAECFVMKQDWNKGIEHLNQAYIISMKIGDLDEQVNHTLKLSDLYAKKNNYEQAFIFNQKHLYLKDSLSKQNKQRDLVLLAVERENKKYQADLVEMEKEQLRIRNLQYMGISIAISILFMMLILFGMFTVPKIIIRMIGFIAFICLFEFIILLIDSYVHHAAHGDALIIWLIKIGVLAILFPSHHYLEHAMVHFIESKKLMKLKEQISVKNFITKIKTPAKVVGVKEEKEVTI
jgi:hypothetical protein